MGISNVYPEGLSFSTMVYYFPFSSNTAVSVSGKLTWLGDECHSYECHSCMIVYSAPKQCIYVCIMDLVFQCDK